MCACHINEDTVITLVKHEIDFSCSVRTAVSEYDVISIPAHLLAGFVLLHDAGVISASVSLV